MFRWLGFILIISGTSSAGIVMAAKIKNELRVYRAAQNAISYIRSEIEFFLTPLDQILLKLSQQITPPLSLVFEQVAGSIVKTPGLSPGILFQEHADLCGGCIPAELKGILCDTFTYLGKQEDRKSVV